MNSDFVIRKEDGAVIPADPLNIDYVAYQQWLSEGNIPEQEGTVYYPVPSLENNDPVEKFKNFLLNNPDVAEILIA